MSDVNQLNNYRPGDDGNLTTGDFHKLVTEVFLSAMRPLYDIAAEDWRTTRTEYMKLTGLDVAEAYRKFRAERLDPNEQVERARAEQTVKKILAIRAQLSTGKLVRTSLTEDES